MAVKYAIDKKQSWPCCSWFQSVLFTDSIEVSRRYVWAAIVNLFRVKVKKRLSITLCYRFIKTIKKTNTANFEKIRNTYYN